MEYDPARECLKENVRDFDWEKCHRTAKTLSTIAKRCNSEQNPSWHGSD